MTLSNGTLLGKVGGRIGDKITLARLRIILGK